MKIDLHAAARVHIDQLAEELLTLVRSAPEGTFPPSRQSFTSGVPVAAKLDETMVSDVRVTALDGYGRETGRYFLVPDKGEVGLSGNDLATFQQLVERLANRAEVRELVSTQTIDDLLFDWIRERASGKHTDAFCGCLAAALEDQIAEFEIWFPIATLQVQEEFKLGEAVIRTITEAHIEAWTAHYPGTDIAAEAQSRERLRKRIQGLAAASIKVYGEKRKAEERASEAAEAAVSMLRLFSVEIMHPHGWTLCSTEGLSAQGGSVVITLREGEITRLRQAVPSGLRPQWTLSTTKISELMKHGLEDAHELLTMTKRSAFQQQLLGALRHYSIAPLKKDPAEKLLYVVSALEAILLGGPDEGQISQNFRERFALLRASSLEDRREVLERASQVYSERSRFVHGGVRSADLKLLEDFMMDAWCVFFGLLRNHRVFTDKRHFIATLEAHKLGGPAFGQIVVEQRTK